MEVIFAHRNFISLLLFCVFFMDLGNLWGSLYSYICCFFYIYMLLFKLKKQSKHLQKLLEFFLYRRVFPLSVILIRFKPLSSACLSTFPLQWIINNVYSLIPYWLFSAFCFSPHNVTICHLDCCIGRWWLKSSLEKYTAQFLSQSHHFRFKINSFH